MLDGRGEAMASRELPPRAAGRRARRDPRARSRARNAPGAPTPFEPAHEAVAGRALALPVAPDARGGPQAWLVGGPRRAAALGEFERLILQQAVTVVALELMRRRVVRDTERRLAGDILAEAVDGRARRARAARPAAPVRRRRRRRRCSSSTSTSRPAPRPRSSGCCSRPASARWSRPASGLLCAVVDGRRGRPARARGAVRATRSRASTATCAPRPAGSPPLGIAAAQLPRGALRARGRRRCSNGRAPEVASWRDLGAFQFLLSVQDDEALRALLRQRARARSRTARASTAASCCARSRRSSSTTASGRRPRGSSSATATRCATGSGASSSSPGRDLAQRARPDRVLARAAGRGSWSR